MKLGVLIAAVLAASSTVAAPGSTCERWEYARLKDSTKGELIDSYCSSRRGAKLNEDLRAIDKELFDQQIALGNLRGADETRLKMSGRFDEQIKCVEAAGDARRMLERRHNIKAEPKCQ